MAAAAEAAGYRACLRCRPYRASQLLPATAPELVCRAVRLILDGALDGATEATLGRRLGVSPRHLRRLFAAHLGVTPDGLARSARAHFARRLLDDTDLSITQVAFAAGYGSLRQFNRACHEIFRASPSELRARRRARDRLVADGGLALRLPYAGPLDWDGMLESFALHAVPGVENVSARTYRRTVAIAGEPGVLELVPDTPEALTLVAHLPHWDELIHVVERARHIANLDLELDEPIRVLARDPVIGPMIASRPGRRPPGTWDPFETGVQAIIGHSSTGSAARGRTAELVETFGTRVSGLESMGLTHVFPSVQTIASADLSTVGLSGSERRAIEAFATGLRDDVIPLDRSIGLDQLIETLVGRGGMTRRSAQYLALRIGEPDAFPVEHAIGDSWRPWRALAATYLQPTVGPTEHPETAADRHAA